MQLLLPCTPRECPSTHYIDLHSYTTRATTDSSIVAAVPEPKADRETLLDVMKQNATSRQTVVQKPHAAADAAAGGSIRLFIVDDSDDAGENDEDELDEYEIVHFVSQLEKE